MLHNKTVLLCVGGGIAAYKSADLVRELGRQGATVQVAMTAAACRFITPLTLQTLSGRPVATDLLNAGEEAEIGHITIADQADVVIVAPATANLIARMAQGRADDVVTAALLATRAPVVVAPSMNTNMLEHPAVVSNLERLADFGYRIVEPDNGELACGWEGRGRLPDSDVLVEELQAALSCQDLAGLRVLVSAGPTREALDPVRYLSNRSSGTMGYEIARAARRRGAEVTLVSGPTALSAPVGCRRIAVESAADMAEAMRQRVTDADIVVMVAAVADYRPLNPADRKIKKPSVGGDAGLRLELEQTEDILASLARARGNRVVVGFAAETHDLERHARDKLERKGVDLIVANDVSAEGSGFGSPTNSALLIDRQGRVERSGLVGKDELAGLILDRALALRVPVAMVAGAS
ncbi:MAG: bifunctional phosphopantothenoylcysteine decarboxylase/phosphopantothenate--cysteine ligase CoaBC [Deltaproteobacteria bacterium]